MKTPQNGSPNTNEAKYLGFTLNNGADKSKFGKPIKHISELAQYDQFAIADLGLEQWMTDFRFKGIKNDKYVFIDLQSFLVDPDEHEYTKDEVQDMVDNEHIYVYNKTESPNWTVSPHPKWMSTFAKADDKKAINMLKTLYGEEIVGEDFYPGQGKEYEAANNRLEKLINDNLVKVIDDLEHIYVVNERPKVQAPTRYTVRQVLNFAPGPIANLLYDTANRDQEQEYLQTEGDLENLVELILKQIYYPEQNPIREFIGFKDFVTLASNGYMSHEELKELDIFKEFERDYPELANTLIIWAYS